MAESVTFIDCTSLNISYNVMGIVTVTFTLVSNTPGFKTRNIISAGGKIFKGYIASASLNQIPNTVSWYETHLTLIATIDV